MKTGVHDLRRMHVSTCLERCGAGFWTLGLIDCIRFWCRVPAATVSLLTSRTRASTLLVVALDSVACMPSLCSQMNRFRREREGESQKQTSFWILASIIWNTDQYDASDRSEKVIIPARRRWALWSAAVLIKLTVRSVHVYILSYILSCVVRGGYLHPLYITSLA